MRHHIRREDKKKEKDLDSCLRWPKSPYKKPTIYKFGIRKLLIKFMIGSKGTGSCLVQVHAFTYILYMCWFHITQTYLKSEK